MRPAVAVLACALIQATAPRPASLQGHAVRAGSNAPIAHARIVVAKVGGALQDYRTTATNQSGHFGVEGLTPGTYRIYATRDGYLQAEFGRRPAGTSGVPVAIAEGQTTADLELVMTPTGVIAGHVLRGGEPVRHAWVRALRTSYFNGERSLVPSDWTQTDDRGEYRLFGLAPGSYVVNAAARGRPRIEGDSLVTPTVASNANGNQLTERTMVTLETIDARAFDPAVYPVVYHPGTIDAAAAQPIEVRAGATVAGIDLVLVPAGAVHVRGQVTFVDVQPLSSSVRVSLQSAESSGALPAVSAQSDASGTFDIAGVGPGRYYVTAQVTGQGSAPLWDAVRVDVADADVKGVSIALRLGVKVTGRLTIDGQPPPAGGPILVQLQGIATRGSCCGGRAIAADGTFAIDNVPPREYRFRVIQGGRTPWVKSARFGGEDVLTGPIRIASDLQGRELEIDLSTHTATLDALVVAADQRPLSGVLVIAVPPADRRDQSSLFRSATAGADGHARFEGLAPLDYTLFATDSIPAADWQDPSMLQRVEGRGTVVRLRESEVRTVTLRITP